MNNFIAITHIDFINQVKVLLGKYVCRAETKYLTLLTEYIQTIENTMSISKTMHIKELDDFYHKNIDFINQLENIKKELSNFYQNRMKQLLEAICQIKLLEPYYNLSAKVKNNIIDKRFVFWSVPLKLKLKHKNYADIWIAWNYEALYIGIEYFDKNNEFNYQETKSVFSSLLESYSDNDEECYLAIGHNIFDIEDGINFCQEKLIHFFERFHTL